jgi:nitroimidazol reductase NimA-like FMN-containing flavoprotein (pyridoxamine 5'-phosphate oxidase superfamily)
MAEPTAGRPHMPGYGIAESGEGLLPWSWAEERLVASHRYWVATSDGEPHLMPVWAVWFDDSLWFSSGGRSRKVRNLRANPRCAVQAGDGDPVILHGTVEFVADPDPALLATYAAKYGEAPPDPAANPVVRVCPTYVFGLVESAFSSTPTRWDFTR